MSVTVCRGCGTQGVAGSRYCAACGSRLSPSGGPRPRRRRRTSVQIIASIAAAGIISSAAWVAVSWSGTQALDAVKPVGLGDVDVHVSTPQSPHYVVPGSVDSLSLPEPGGDLGDWLERQDAVPADTIAVDLLFRAPEGRTVHLEDIDVREEARRPPLAGVQLPPQGGGDVDKYIVEVSLDVPPPGNEFLSSQELAEGTWEFPLWYTTSENESVRVLVSAFSCDCDFRIVVSYTLDGDPRPRTHVVDDEGRPFRVTSTAATDPMRSLARDVASVTGDLSWGGAARRICGTFATGGEVHAVSARGAIDCVAALEEMRGAHAGGSRPGAWSAPPGWSCADEPSSLRCDTGGSEVSGWTLPSGASEESAEGAEVEPSPEPEPRAGAEPCGAVGTPESDFGLLDIRARGVSCAVALHLAQRVWDTGLDAAQAESGFACHTARTGLEGPYEGVWETECRHGRAVVTFVS